MVRRESRLARRSTPRASTGAAGPELRRRGRRPGGSPRSLGDFMGKTLVIAEKPSVGRDLAGALPDSFKSSKDKTYLEGDDYVITWAVGHLVGLAPPDDYDPKLKKWRFADLPILPEQFRLVPNDEKSKKQLNAIHRWVRDDDVELIVNACDAGREGELIFAYVYETAGVQKPIKRLWLSSMTRKAIKDAFERLRDGEELKSLEAAARSRSEADWVVGMNATRAASIRLRSAFDGAVSLGRVQTPTLALVARREEEIRAFKPEPYWLVEAGFEATERRVYRGRYMGGKRLPEEDARAIVEAVTGGTGTITKLEKKEEREKPQLLYDVTSLDKLPLGRVVNDDKVDDHHALIPTRSEHDLDRMGSDERRVYDLVAKRFLAIFHPDAVYERTRVETTVSEHVFRTSGRRMLEPGFKAVYGEEADPPERTDDDTGGDQLLPRLEQGENAEVKDVESLRKETQPPRRFTEASLLGAMETAGKDIDDVEMREAMKDSGIGTPATRAAIIERLIDVAYIERDGRALHATEKGVQVIRLLGEHPLTSPALTGDWESWLTKIEHGGDSRPKFMSDIAEFTRQTVLELDKLKDVKIERQNLGPCPVCGRDVIENRKGYSCWSREDPGCGFVIWKKKAGKNLPVQAVKELMESLKASRERGDEPPVGRTAKPVTGFRGRSGRTFRAKLRIEQSDDGKWRVEFDEDWAKEPPKGEAEGESGDGAAAPAEATEGAA